MQPEMKIAKTVKRQVASMGYRVDQRSFNTEQLWLLFERMLTLVLQFLDVLYVANNLRQYVESIFMIIVGTLLYVSLVSTIIEMPTIFTLIDDLEHVINESEYFCMLLNSCIQCADRPALSFLLLT